jgi:hypothetical protein
MTPAPRVFALGKAIVCRAEKASALSVQARFRTSDQPAAGMAGMAGSAASSRRRSRLNGKTNVKVVPAP